MFVMIEMIIMYPNIIFLNVVSLFFQIYSIINAQDRYYLYFEIHFMNFNVAPDCSNLCMYERFVFLSRRIFLLDVFRNNQKKLTISKK